jgi:hypothetical protein
MDDVLHDEIDAVHIFVETVVGQLEAHLGNQHDANGETYSKGEDFDEFVG